MPSKQMTPVVVDLSHHNEINDWSKVYKSGIRGVIHKSTQGIGMVDTTYASRRAAATAAGLLWGAYHFADNSDVTKQVDNFLAVAKPDDKTLLCLDFEPNGSRTMSLEQAKEFLQQVYTRTGQRALLYSGNLIKESLKGTADEFFNDYRLWVCQYGAKAKLPPGWDNYWLWQYTGDGAGPLPHSVPGITTNGIDLNVFGGTDLAAEWVNKPKPSRSDEMADSSSPVLGSSTLDIINAGDLAAQSRGVGFLMMIKNWATKSIFGGAGGSAYSLSDINEQVKQGHTLMQAVAAEPLLVASLCAVLFGVSAWAAAHYLVGLRLQDVFEGRYIPSKAQGA